MARGRRAQEGCDAKDLWGWVECDEAEALGIGWAPGDWMLGLPLAGYIARDLVRHITYEGARRGFVWLLRTDGKENRKGANNNRERKGRHSREGRSVDDTIRKVRPRWVKARG